MSKKSDQNISKAVMRWIKAITSVRFDRVAVRETAAMRDMSLGWCIRLLLLCFCYLAFIQPA